MASLKKLEFPSGTDVTEPSDLSVTNSANHLETYASDAAFVSANGTAVAGDFYLNTSAENPRVYVSGAWKDVGSGGAGGRNYLSSEFEGTRAVGTVTNGLTATGNRSANQDTWGADNTAKLTIANNTSSPLRQTGDFKITHVTTGTAFIESRMFNLDTADLNKAISISFDLTGNTTADDFDVVVMRYNSSGTYQETISVAGTASSGTPASAQLPTGTTKFTGFFISSNTQTDYYSVRFRRLSAVATTSVQFDSFFAGPQTVLTGFVGTDLKTAVSGMTWTNVTLGSSPINVVKYKRNGDSALIYGTLELGTGGSFTGTIGATIPTEIGTVNTTILASSNVDYTLGSCWLRNENGASDPEYTGTVVFQTSSGLIQFVPNSTSDGRVNATQPFTWAAGDRMSYSFELPITAWTSNTTLAERAVEEYAFNTGTWDADDSTSFGNGVGGVLMSGSLTGNRTKQVRFNTPILPTDTLILEVSSTLMPTRWFKMGARIGSAGLETEEFHIQNTLSYGATIDASSSVPSTDCVVRFARYASSTGATYGAAGQNWNNDTYWRVRKVSGGASVGYPINASNIIIDHDSTPTSNSLKSGTYTPTFTNVSNVAAGTPTLTMWTRIGNVVSVFGYINIDVTSASTASEFRITLPVTSNLALSTDLQGVGSHGQAATAYASVRISADTTNDAAGFTWYAGGDAANREMSFNFSYIVK